MLGADKVRLSQSGCQDEPGQFGYLAGVVCDQDACHAFHPLYTYNFELCCQFVFGACRARKSSEILQFRHKAFCKLTIELATADGKVVKYLDEFEQVLYHQ
jgi:hypothetical protein